MKLPEDIEVIRSVPLPNEFPGVHAMDEEEVEAAVRVCRSKSLYRYYGTNLGRETESFEREFATFLDIPFVLGVASGTAALHTALAALRVGPGDEVILPSYMWVSVVAAVVNSGAIPVLAEVDDTFCLDPADVERRITPRTAGVIAVHMNGGAAEIYQLSEIARRHGLFLLEDCAQSAGCTINGQKVGTFGDIAIFSFQLNKNMTAGEAGAVVTRDETLFRRSIAVHDMGYPRNADGRIYPTDEEYFSWAKGVRLDELRSAILRVQLKKLETTLSRMRKSKTRVVAALKEFPWASMRRMVADDADTGGFLLVTYPTAEIAKHVRETMCRHGIVTWSPDTSNVLLANYGLHIYYNIPGLTLKIGADRRGGPWTLEENRLSNYDYTRGVCPVSDDLFSRTQMLVIPSCLTTQDEDDIILSFRLTLGSIIGPAMLSALSSAKDNSESQMG